MNNDMHGLLETELEGRDALWERRFLELLPKQRLKIRFDEPKQGPDGWPYLWVETGDDSDEPVAQVLQWLSSRGIGLVVNPLKDAPDFVLSYGMVWNYVVRGEFLSEAPVTRPGRFEIASGERLYVGPPSESYLPANVRRILRQFLLDQGVLRPRVLVLQSDPQGAQTELCFSIESLGSPPEHEHSGIAEALGWFLPAHYVVTLLSERMVEGFADL